MVKFCWCADTLVLAISACLVLVHFALRVTFYVRTVGGCDGLLALSATLKRALWGCVQICTNLLRRGRCSALSTIEELVKRKVSQRRFEIQRTASVIFAHTLTIGLVSFCVRTLSEQQLRVTVPQIVCIMTSMVMSMFMYSTSSLTSILVEVHYAGMMLLCAIYVWSSPADSFALSLSSALLARFVITVLHLDGASAAFWNLVALGATYACLAQHALHNETNELLLYFDVVTTIAGTLASASIERLAASVAHHEVHTSNLSAENSSSMLLLDVVCDVALKVNDQFRIMRDSPSFAAFLLKDSPSSMEGESFASFIEDRFERRRFEKALLEDTNPTRKVGACQASLSDALCNRINVELFFVRVEMDVDISHYLIGLRELPDAQLTELPTSSSKRTRKRRRALSDIGTPPSCEQSHLEENVARPSARIPRRCRFPELKLTTDGARLCSLAATLSTWVIHTEHATCCNYHAYVMAGKTTLSKLANAPCNANFPNVANEVMQCQACGIIDSVVAEGDIVSCSVCASNDIETIQRISVSADASDHYANSKPSPSTTSL
eukprot:TRINITY_DN13634_c1_g1_i1.p1 TRINITY_DN13634_c1_g1~~TRINITY_DN13634_c1_g1_i1.p1  ORF type:complete len:553 (-),score=45.08 TRINITY_DN13634_c1_g1_i1:243-1901(-)